MSEYLIKFENVGLHYGNGREVLRDVGFRLEAGSYHFLTGASGAGKTSILKLLYLGQRPTRGRILILGHDVLAIPRKKLILLRREIGIVFQDFRLLPHLTAFDNVALPLRASNIHEEDIRNNVTELLRWVGLGDRLFAYPETLSGGEQQRIAIARAIINRPKILLADEPTGNVDDRIGNRIMYLLEQLNKLGTTVVVATHDENLIHRFPHPQLHIADGKVIPRPLHFTDTGEAVA